MTTEQFAQTNVSAQAPERLRARRAEQVRTWNAMCARIEAHNKAAQREAEERAERAALRMLEEHSAEMEVTHAE